MSMNLLPDDCLLHIFNSIHDIHTLFKCLRVCKRWNYLVNYRLKRAERLLDDGHSYVKSMMEGDDKILWYDTLVRPLEEQILSKIFQKSPKMRVVSVGYEDYRSYDREWLQKSVDCLAELKSLEGLILDCQGSVLNVIPQSVKTLYIPFDTIIQAGYYPQVKHLIADDVFFIHCIHRFPNLELLHLRVENYQAVWFEDACKKQHLFSNLKLLEIDSTYINDYGDPIPTENYAVTFMNFCPQLESAHIRLFINVEVPDDNFRHKNLTNLVITFAELEPLAHSLSNLRNLLKRFPYVKHLAINYFYELNAENSSCKVSADFVAKVNKLIPMIVLKYLKKLVLLDMRDISGIDESVAEMVQSICKLQKRSIKFYYGKPGPEKMIRDCPQLFDEDQDSSTFKFMSRHFLLNHFDFRESAYYNVMLKF